MEHRVRELETGQVETRVYVKQIKEDIQEIKSSIKEINASPAKQTDTGVKVWQPIVFELIKLLGLCVAILGAIVGAIRLLGMRG